MTIPAAVQQWINDEFGAYVPTQVAFGTFTAPGGSPPMSITGGALVIIWGEWNAGLLLTISRSADGGVTWTDTMTFPTGASVSGSVYAASSGLARTMPTGTALYTLRLDAPFPGGHVHFAAYQ